MVKNDKLEQLTDAELSEVFAVEVGGWTKEPRGRPWNEVMCLIDEKGKINSPQYATDANAVLPWLEKQGSWYMEYCRFDESYNIWIYNDVGQRYTFCGTLPRAACVALIRAKRAEQQTTGESK